MLMPYFIFEIKVQNSNFLASVELYSNTLKHFLVTSRSCWYLWLLKKFTGTKLQKYTFFMHSEKYILKCRTCLTYDGCVSRSLRLCETKVLQDCNNVSSRIDNKLLDQKFIKNFNQCEIQPKLSLISLSSPAICIHSDIWIWWYVNIFHGCKT